MAGYDMLKDAISIARKIDNIELIEKLFSLQKEIEALQEEKTLLSDEKAILIQKLDMKGRLKFDGKVYWDGEEGPYCPICWENNDKVIHVVTEENDWNGTQYYKCLNNDCHYRSIIEKGEMPKTGLIY